MRGNLSNRQGDRLSDYQPRARADKRVSVEGKRVTKLLMTIDRRAHYLDRAFPKPPDGRLGPMVSVELPSEPWAERYQALKTLPASLLPRIEKIYGAEAKLRSESPIITMIRYAAFAGSADSEQEANEQAKRAMTELLYAVILALPDSGRAVVEKFIIEHSPGGER